MGNEFLNDRIEQIDRDKVDGGYKKNSIMEDKKIGDMKVLEKIVSVEEKDIVGSHLKRIREVDPSLNKINEDQKKVLEKYLGKCDESKVLLLSKLQLNFAGDWSKFSKLLEGMDEKQIGNLKKIFELPGDGVISKEQIAAIGSTLNLFMKKFEDSKMFGDKQKKLLSFIDSYYDLYGYYKEKGLRDTNLLFNNMVHDIWHETFPMEMDKIEVNTPPGAERW